LNRNLIIRLNRDNIEDRTSSVYKSIDIPSKRDEIQKCLSHSLNQVWILIKNIFLIFFEFLKKAFDCENHVRVLLRRKTKYNDIFVCSTNAFSPKIYYFNVRKFIWKFLFYIMNYYLAWFNWKTRK